MFRTFVFALLFSPTIGVAAEPNKLDAPGDWGGETIKLPPGFAPDMNFKGVEHIRFAPGMFKPDTDSFFSYALVFELDPAIELTPESVKDEFLKYYRGLCKAVLGGNLGRVDPSTFKMRLQRADDEADGFPTSYEAQLDWVEPFSTKKRQRLNLEIQTWNDANRTFVFVCVSPQDKNATIWKQLHKIRDGYLNTK